MSSSIFFSNFHIFFSNVFGLVIETSDADTEILTLLEVSELEEELDDEEEEEDEEDDEDELSRARQDLDLFFFYFLFFSLSSVSLSFIFSFFPFFFLRLDLGSLSVFSLVLTPVASCFFFTCTVSMGVTVTGGAMGIFDWTVISPVPFASTPVTEIRWRTLLGWGIFDSSFESSIVLWSRGGGRPGSCWLGSIPFCRQLSSQLVAAGNLVHVL